MAKEIFGPFKQLYTAKFGSKSVRIGLELFYDAIADDDSRREQPKRFDVINSLFRQSKLLGFTPGEKELGELKACSV